MLLHWLISWFCWGARQFDQCVLNFKRCCLISHIVSKLIDICVFYSVCSQCTVYVYIHYSVSKFKFQGVLNRTYINYRNWNKKFCFGLRQLFILIYNHWWQWRVIRKIPNFWDKGDLNSCGFDEELNMWCFESPVYKATIHRFWKRGYQDPQSKL